MRRSTQSRRRDYSDLERFVSAFGEEAFLRLRSSSVAIVGCGGTGSATIATLARAGIGKLILIDPDTVDHSNLERLHGGFVEHAEKEVPKVIVARELVEKIDPSIEVVSLQGRLPQSDVVDAVVSTDVALGCTDQQHSRLALSDISFRYLVPAIDAGVVLEGDSGFVTGQIGQLVRMLANDPCLQCRSMINAQRVSQEMMTESERERRIKAAQRAGIRGEEETAYWLDEPQINTVGYLTTTIGGLLAGYAIGWLTGRFDPPFERLQLNLVAKFLDVTDQKEEKRPDCPCNLFRGWGDQANADALITPASHWPNVIVW